jgi:L-lactate dehydrogenase
VGTGTFLDSERFAYYLAKNTSLDQVEIDALVLGEHGESFVPVLSRTQYKGKPIQEQESFTKEVIDKAIYQTHHAAFEIRKTEPGTSMAVSHCALRIMEYWSQENETIVPISVLVDSELVKTIGLKHPVVMSIPVRISSAGIQRETPLQLSPEECNQLKKSAETLQQYQGFLKST